MVDISPEVIMAINFAAFAAFASIGGIFLYLGKSLHLERKLSLPWVNLSFGTILIGINYLIQALFVTRIEGDPAIAMSSYLLIIGGTAMALTSFAILYTERATEYNTLKRREEDLKEITIRLRNKFMRREISEDEMKKINIDLVRELSEIEVKLDRLKRRAAS